MDNSYIEFGYRIFYDIIIFNIMKGNVEGVGWLVVIEIGPMCLNISIKSLLHNFASVFRESYGVWFQFCVFLMLI